MTNFIHRLFERFHERQRAFGIPRSSKWPEVEKAFRKLHPRCEVCGTDKDINIHHLKSFATHPELELDFDNLWTVCRIHHFWLCHLGSWASLDENAKADCLALADKIKHRPSWNGKEWVYN